MLITGANMIRPYTLMLTSLAEILAFFRGIFRYNAVNIPQFFTKMIDSQTLKAQLLEFNQQQKNAFPNQDIHSLLCERSHFYDSLLCDLWQQFGLNNRTDLALIAVGGYGRQEMFPLSDLDILVLCKNPLDENTHQQLNALFNLLWDSKFQLGSAVRTIDECLEIGRNELSVASNMFESRFLFGNESLWQRLMARIFQDDFWAIQPFFYAKIEERNQRYARYHNTSYNLEPDLKHSPGGLRDLHLIQWIMLRHYGTNNFKTLMDKGIFYPEEWQELEQAQNVLFKMRFALHLQLKRYDNRLRFDRQLMLSEQLGFIGEGNSAVEKMMKEFFQATQSISQISRLVLHDFKHKIIEPLQKKGEKQPLDDLFILRDQWISIQNPLIFSSQPHRVLDLFFHLTQQPQAKIDIHTLRQLRLSLKKQTTPLCFDPIAREKFIRLFHQPNVVSRAVVPMHQFGVLTAYLPQWSAIEGLMQFDLFHIYTVDEHTIRVMRHLEFFLSNESREQFPLCSKLFPALPNRHLLYLAALFHDIAKGRDGDHAENGAVDMLEFAKLHGFNQAESDYMAWLVAQHLTMSITAQRRDIHDPEIVQQFAKIVENQTALNALTCLTVADIHATNETLWNDWKRTLFIKLHQLTSEQLKQGQDKALDQHKLALENQNAALEQLKLILSYQQHKRLSDFWQSCPKSYFIRHNPTQLVWHALSYVKNPTLPMVLVSNQYARGATEIFVYCDDQAQLFARIAQTLSKKKISIHDAQIITTPTGFVLDSFIVTESDGTPLNSIRQQQILSALVKTLTNDRKVAFKPIKNPVKHSSFHRKTKVRFLNNEMPNQTAFEIFTPDRDGLLAHLGYIFSEFKLNLTNAKITTIGEKVEDFFAVTNQDNNPLSPEMCKALQERILTELEK